MLAHLKNHETLTVKGVGVDPYGQPERQYPAFLHLPFHFLMKSFMRKQLSPGF